VDAKHGGQGGHDRLRGLAGHQFGIQEALGGVIDHREQGLALVGDQGQPGMWAPIEVEHLAKTGAGLAALVMAAAGAALAH
jgi:hypothetical protein